MKRKLKFAFVAFSLLVVSGLTFIRWADPGSLAGAAECGL